MPATAPTVRSFAPRYLAHARHELKASTFADYSRVLACHVLPAIGDRPLSRLTTADAFTIRERLLGHPSRANRAVNVLSAMLRTARQLGLRTGNFERPKRLRESKRSRYLTHEEVGRLFAVLDARKDRAAQLIRLLALTGLRRGEAFNLRWEEVDAEHSVLRLRDTKTGESVRPLSPAALAVILAQPRTCAYVFPGEVGGPTRSVDRAWRTIRKAAGLGLDVCLHTLRHSFASFAVNAGVPLASIGADDGPLRSRSPGGGPCLRCRRRGPARRRAVSRPLADDPHELLRLATAARGVPLSLCEACDELSSLSRCPLCRGLVWPINSDELALDIEADDSGPVMP
jgi:integrase